MNTPTISRRQILKLAGVTLVASNPAVTRAAEKNSAQAAIEALERKYDEAFNGKNAAALAALYLDDAQILAADKPIVKGRQAIEEFWKGDMAAATPGAANTSSPLEIEEHGRVASETGTWKEAKSSGELVSTGKYMVLWKRQGGQWKIHREIWNKDESPAKA